VLHDHVAAEAVKYNKANLSEEDKGRGQEVSKAEGHAMLHVQEEAVPSGCAEVVTGDSHVSVGLIVNVVAHLLDASKTAVCTTDNHFKSRIFSGSFLSLLSDRHNNDSNELDDGNNA
jgi:D-aminopeptidase